MGFIEFVKSALGLESTQREQAGQPGEGASSGQDVAVTVEHEPDTAAEDAIKGTDSAAETDEERTEKVTEDAETSPDDEPEADVSAETPEAEHTGQEQTDRTSEATESEATEPVDRSEAPGQPDTVEEESEAESTAEADTDVSGAETETVQSIKGIGPAYADRLADAGIKTVADLEAAAVETVADDTGIAESRVSTWMERANE